MSDATVTPTLYDLLPAVYRTRDLRQGGALRALFEVMEGQGALLEENLLQLYDDQFIETCAPWAVPYIGQLIGFEPIYTSGTAASEGRAEVANTIGYRRRKGTHLALQQVATDVASRPVIVVEEFRNLLTNLSLRNTRNPLAATLRMGASTGIRDPFARAAHTVDVRSIAPRNTPPADPDAVPLGMRLHGGGRFNLPNVSLWMWRWRSFPMTGVPAFAKGVGRFLFHPLGIETALFQQPPLRIAFDRLSTVADVPRPIAWQDFAGDVSRFYPSSLQLVADGVPVDTGLVVGADLRCGGANLPPDRIAVDPATGRIQFGPEVALPVMLTVDFCVGFPGEVGGGPYDRSDFLAEDVTLPAGWTALVGSADYPTFASAVAGWNALPTGSSGRILVPSYGVFTEDLTGMSAILLSGESSLLIAAAEMVPDDPEPPLPVWIRSWPSLVGDLEVRGLPAAPLPDGDTPPLAVCRISGLRIAGQVRLGGEACSLQMEDTTLIPGLSLTECGDPLQPCEPSLLTTDLGPGGCVCLDRCITGPVAVSSATSLRLTASIVDAGSPCCPAIAGPDLVRAGPSLHVEDSTVIGKVHVQAMPLASNTIFIAKLHRLDGWAAPVWSRQRQSGCVRFCSVPWASLTPRRYRCLPDTATDGAALQPRFVSLQYGNPGYCLLSEDTPYAVWTGADNGSQMGVWMSIAETEAVRNVQLRAPDFLPAGYGSGVFLMPSSGTRHRPLRTSVYGVTQSVCDCEQEQDAPPMGIGIRLL